MTRIVARHPVLAFMAISLGVGFLTAAVRPIAEADVLPFGMPLHGFLSGLLALVSPHSWLLQPSQDATVLLILPGAVCAGVSRCGGIWWHCSPFRWGRRLFRLRSSAQKRWPHQPAAGRELWRRWPQSLCSSWCSFSLPKR